jgi:hypothetical protein
VAAVRDFRRWTDDEVDGWLREQAALAGLEFAVEQRSPTVWFAAVRDANGLALVGAEALSDRWAKNALAQILDSLTEGELQRLTR